MARKSKRERDAEPQPEVEAQTDVQAAPEFESGAAHETQAEPAAEPPALELVLEPGPTKHIDFAGNGRASASEADVEPEEEQEVPDASRRGAASRSHVAALREPIGGEPDPAPPLRELPDEARSDSSYSTLRSIHSEIDRIGSPDHDFSGRPGRANLRPSTASRTVYRTESGNEVRVYDGPRRTLTLTRREGDRVEERPFHESMVDEVVAGVDLGEESDSRGSRQAVAQPQLQAEPATESETSEPVTESGATEEAKPKRRFGFFGRRAKPDPKPEPASDASPVTSESQYETAIPIDELGGKPVRVQAPATVDARADEPRSSYASHGWDPESHGASALEETYQHDLRDLPEPEAPMRHASRSTTKPNATSKSTGKSTRSASKSAKKASSGLTRKQLAQRKYAGSMGGVRKRAAAHKGGKGPIAERSAAKKLRRDLGLKSGK